jgi:hypothetical protein
MREALQTVSDIEQSLPQAFGPRLGFSLIESALRKRIRDRPEELRAAIRTTGYPINVLVVILARSIACDELESEPHDSLDNRTTMTGDALMSLHGHLTDLLEKAGAAAVQAVC